MTKKKHNILKRIGIKITTIIVSSLFLVSCNQRNIYSEYRSIEQSLWHKDSLLTYNMFIEDTSSTYDVFINVRHIETYSFQNLWFFISHSNTNHSNITLDTIEFYLANDRGAWLGSGRNGIIEMPVLYEQNYHFHQIGEQRYTIQHGMRDSLLGGKYEVGIIIKKNE